MLPDQGEMSPHAPDGTPLIDKSVSLNETWAAMEDLLATGKVKTIGICNMIQSEVEQILKTAKHKPDIMQMEVGRLPLLLPLQHLLQALTPPPPPLLRFTLTSSRDPTSSGFRLKASSSPLIRPLETSTLPLPSRTRERSSTTPSSLTSPRVCPCRSSMDNKAVY